MPWTDKDTKRMMKRLQKRTLHLHRRALKRGHEVVLARDGKLIKICKDGKIEVLKELPPRHHVPKGTKLHIKYKPNDPTNSVRTVQEPATHPADPCS